MSDGWETRRRRGPGHDWAILELGRPGIIRRIEVDTLHFKGNAPGSCSVEVARAAGAALPELLDGRDAWAPLLAETRLTPDSLHVFEREVLPAGEATHARFHIYPDGGVSRLRLFGRFASPGRS